MTDQRQELEYYVEMYRRTGDPQLRQRIDYLSMKMRGIYGISPSDYGQMSSAAAARFQYEQQQKYEGATWDPMAPPPSPPKKKKEPPPAERTDEDISKAFLALCAESLPRRKHTIQEKVLHEMKIGELKEFKENQAKEIKAAEEANPKAPRPRLICPICLDPLCPYSE